MMPQVRSLVSAFTTTPTNAGNASNSDALPPLAPSGDRRRTSFLFGFRRTSSNNINNNGTNISPQSTTRTSALGVSNTTRTSALGTVPTIQNGTTGAGATDGGDAVARRRDSARASLTQRRASLLMVQLNESRTQDERPDTTRHQKRPSTTGSDIIQAIQAAGLVEENGQQPLSVEEIARVTLATTTPVTTQQQTANGNHEESKSDDAPETELPSVPTTRSTPVSTTTTTTTTAPTPGGNQTATAPQPASTISTTGSSPTAPQSNRTITGGAPPRRVISGESPNSTSHRIQKGREGTTSNTKTLDPMRPDIQVSAPTVKQLPQLTLALRSGDKEEELRAVIGFRMILSKSFAAPIQEVVNCGVVPHFVQCLSRDGEDRLQLESSWALTNIASGTTEHTMLVINAGALPLLLRLLKSPNREIREQSIWGVGNISGDSPRTRDIVLNNGAVKHLVPQMYLEMDRKDPGSASLLRNMVWATANFCRGKPPPPFDKVRPLLAPLKRVLQLNDHEMLADACWALNYLSDTNEHIQEVIDTGVCPRLIQLLSHSEHVVKTPALRAVGNIVTGDNDQTQHMLDLNVLDALKPQLSDPRRTIRGETCWTISNITAGSHTQIQMVIDRDIFPLLVTCAMDPETYVAKEAIWAISNATSGGMPEQVVKIASFGCIPALVSALSSFHEMDNRIIMVALEGIENFLIAGDTTDAPQNPFISIVKGCGGLELLKNDLSSHTNDAVSEKANDIVTKYLSSPDLPPAKPAPDMWTPAEVAEAKKREEELREKYRDQTGMLTEEQKNQNRAGRPPRRGSNYIPPQFYCPISQEIMIDPVSTVDGHVYDRENIARWFASGNFTSPVTGAKLKTTQLTPNHPLRQMIEAFMPGYTHRADLDKDWPCIACTSMNSPIEVKCSVCGAERPLMKVQDPDAVPLIYMARTGNEMKKE